MSQHTRDGCEGCVVGLFATTTLLFYFVLPRFGVLVPAWLNVALGVAFFVLVMASWLADRHPPSRQPRQQDQPPQEQSQDELPQA
jgi:hypothetical protein